MSDVKRFDPGSSVCSDVSAQMEPCGDGDYVLFADYETLRAELTEARRQLAAQPAVPEAVEQIRSVLADIVCEDDALKAVNSIRDILSAADSEVKK